MVAGANRGPGFEIGRQLAASDITVLRGARNEVKGKAICENLRNQGFDVHSVLIDVKSATATPEAVGKIKELRGFNIPVNATFPGWVRTDMGGNRLLLSLAQGADTAVWLATLPNAGPTGGFFGARQPVSG